MWPDIQLTGIQLREHEKKMSATSLTYGLKNMPWTYKDSHKLEVVEKMGKVA